MKKLRFYTPKIWVITPKNEGNVGSHGKMRLRNTKPQSFKPEVSYHLVIPRVRFCLKTAGYKKQLTPQKKMPKNNKKQPQQTEMDVSENSDTPKPSILIGFSIANHPFWDTPIFGNTQIPWMPLGLWAKNSHKFLETSIVVKRRDVHWTRSNDFDIALRSKRWTRCWVWRVWGWQKWCEKKQPVRWPLSHTRDGSPQKSGWFIVHASFLDTKLWEFSNVLHVWQGVWQDVLLWLSWGLLHQRAAQRSRNMRRLTRAGWWFPPRMLCFGKSDIEMVGPQSTRVIITPLISVRNIHSKNPKTCLDLFGRL